MKFVRFDRAASVPIVVAAVTGVRKRAALRLIFDTGASCTEFDTAVIEDLGYSARDGIRAVTACGPAGPIQSGYLLQVEDLNVLGLSFHRPKIAVYDFDNLVDMKVDGLLGWDLIREMHLSLDGPRGIVEISSA